MKKKLLTVLLVIVLVFNFICTIPVYADPDDDHGIPESNGEGQLEPGQADDLVNDGTSAPSLGDVVLGLLFQTIAMMINAFPMAIHVVLNIITANPEGPELSASEWAAEVAMSTIEWSMNFDGIGSVLNAVGTAGAKIVLSPIERREVNKFFTIQRTVFNEVAFFNINMFNLKESYTVGSGSNEQTIYQSYPILRLKESAAGWYYTVRLLAMMVNLLVLIYVGIRMSISTVASDEARYKKMLISWAESMILLFLLHYIMNFAVGLGELVLNVIYNLREGLDNPIGFELLVMDKVYNCIYEKTGMQVFMYSCFYWVLVFMQIKFLLMYMKRVLAVMFLTIIAPFITVTYPIDKMGDGKAQAFDAWSKEYILNVAIQPIHAAIYLIFVFSAGTIAEKAPFVALIFLLCLGRIEKIVRGIFGISGSVSVGNFSDELKKKGK